MFYSALTPKGNSSYSYISQWEADSRAAALDAAGCTDCTGCRNCRNCRNCTDCTDCTDCGNCMRCTYCTDCGNCMRCTDCWNCTDCTDCTGCMDCMRCTRCTDCTDCIGCIGEVIQAGRPNGWPCYGWLKKGRLIIHCGCQRKTFEEAIAYWDHPEKTDRREVVAACHYIATVAKLRGWEV